MRQVGAGKGCNAARVVSMDVGVRGRQREGDSKTVGNETTTRRSRMKVRVRRMLKKPKQPRVRAVDIINVTKQQGRVRAVLSCHSAADMSWDADTRYPESAVNATQ